MMGLIFLGVTQLDAIKHILSKDYKIISMGKSGRVEQFNILLTELGSRQGVP